MTDLRLMSDIVYERAEIAIARRFKTTDLRDAPKVFDLEMSSFADECVVELKAWFPRKRKKTQMQYSVPRTWWDHFKDEHPRLCARLSPPEYKQVLHTVYAEAAFTSEELGNMPRNRAYTFHYYLTDEAVTEILA